LALDGPFTEAKEFVLSSPSFLEARPIDLRHGRFSRRTHSEIAVFSSKSREVVKMGRERDALGDDTNPLEAWYVALAAQTDLARVGPTRRRSLPGLP
jgi:hypothetical protein